MPKIYYNDVEYGSNATENASIVALAQKAVSDIHRKKFHEAYEKKVDHQAVVNARKNAAYHNGILRGKNITDKFLDGSMYTAIADGSFDDLFIGDYFIATIDNVAVSFRIAAFNWYWGAKNTDNTRCITPHAVIVPDNLNVNAKMNDTNTSVGGYLGSKMKTVTLPQIQTKLEAVFGSHMMSIKREFSNSINESLTTYNNTLGTTSTVKEVVSKVDLMSEVECIGSLVYGSTGADNVSGPLQFPLFRFWPLSVSSFWTCSVVNIDSFVGFDGHLQSAAWLASVEREVRPRFMLK